MRQKVLALVVVATIATSAFGQVGFNFTNLPPLGWDPFEVADSTFLVGPDTVSAVLSTGAYDSLAYIAKFEGRNDSTNIVILADQGWDGRRWITTDTLDTIIRSGTLPDTLIAEEIGGVLKNWLPKTRIRLVSFAATFDSTSATVTIIPFYMRK